MLCKCISKISNVNVMDFLLKNEAVHKSHFYQMNKQYVFYLQQNLQRNDITLKMKR